MEEFGTNPDIDEKPPISLRDALEKMKPFLMAYEGIQSHEEWEVYIDSLICNVVMIFLHFHLTIYIWLLLYNICNIRD